MVAMDMTQRTDLFNKAVGECDQLLAKFPGRQSLLSIRQQLEYLLALVQGGQDRSRLKDIIIGPLTAREIEPLSAEAAEIFYKVSAEVRLMKNE